jgi:hypothetical protein
MAETVFVANPDTFLDNRSHLRSSTRMDLSFDSLYCTSMGGGGVISSLVGVRGADAGTVLSTAATGPLG